MSKVAIAILAAGKGSRFDDHESKLLALLKGRSLLSYALDSAIESTLSPILLIVGNKKEQIINSCVEDVQIVYNVDWEQGMSTSLKTALETLENDVTITGVCIGLGDQPFIGAKAYERLANVTTEYEQFLAVATYNKKRRNPVLIPRSLWQKVKELKGDMGAKQLMSIYPVIEIDCTDTGNPIDIDTKEQLIMNNEQLSIKN